MLDQRSPSEIRDSVNATRREGKAQRRREWIDRELTRIRNNAERWIKGAAEDGESHRQLYQACFVNGVKKDQYDFLGQDWEFRADGSGKIIMDNLMAEVWRLCQSLAPSWRVRIELHNHGLWDYSFNGDHNYCICAVW